MALIVSEDPSSGVRCRVVLDTDAELITFENCHIQRSFLTTRSDQSKTFDLNEVRSVREALDSLWIRTETGNVRVFSTWSNYDQLRNALGHLTSRDPWYTSPKLIPVYAGLGVLLLVVLLFLLT